MSVITGNLEPFLEFRKWCDTHDLDSKLVVDGDVLKTMQYPVGPEYSDILKVSRMLQDLEILNDGTIRQIIDICFREGLWYDK